MSLSVEYWFVDLQNSEQQSEKLFSLLNGDEKIRAKCFKFQELQHKFIVGRGCLRQILGFYLHQDPAKLNFFYNQYGKPKLNKISFNFSHTKQYAFCGVVQKEAIAIGVDIEARERRNNVLALAKRFFHSDEYIYLEQIKAEKRQATFLQIWTAKEAYLKAKGVGLQGGLDRFKVQLEPEPKIITPEKLDWSLKIFSKDSDHCQAIAVNYPDCDYINRGFWN
ncbi:4'-phosphopantetheinyl transferase family protein [[Limnothrix rosea] IAM M-220]|uniref:4'-phosphopantetheinyl transferase family protein n=1 Tax=[Limnothrix rosea] IAM M-220 TaxID=454133 RepID=UPI000968251E|nr:4'-phosphopantetheinyl transferase superfamily protein [[Limnothrix rosea] IAM M-220]OKH13408.1 hypothetical protein NIES208_15175 [[Limnothrix rosea] IAM M-220]